MLSLPLWQQWNLLLSGRYDSADLDTHNQISGITQENHHTAWSHRVGLSYQFNNGFSPWISTSDSFDPVLGTDADGKAFIPMKSKQYEVGIKYQNPEATQVVSVAAYQLSAINPELQRLELGVTVSNVTNKSYVASCTSSTYCSIGTDRVVLGVLNYYF